MSLKNISFIDPKRATEARYNTQSGNVIDLIDPLEEALDILDIANALSKLCRFGGHITRFYSVAQHSILVKSLAPEHLKREALLHDAAEAFLGDVIKPLKILIEPLYAPLEFKFQQLISQKYGLDPLKLNAIKPYDIQALELEHEALMVGNSERLLLAMKEGGMEIFDDVNPICYEPEEAAAFFTQEFWKSFPAEWEKMMKAIA